MSSTNFVNGSTLSDAGWANDVDTFTYQRLTSVSGTNTIVGTGPVSMTAYAVGQEFAFIPAATNTGATTLNITPSGASALGAKNIFWNGAACVGGEIRIGVPTKVWYDGTQFNLISQPTAKVLGTTTNDSAAAGYLGEYVEALVAAGSAVALSTGTPKTVTSISLTAGDWDVTGVISYTGNAATTTRYSISGVSTTNNTLGANGTFSTVVYALAGSAVFSLIDPGTNVPTQRLSLSGTTTVYLIATLDFAVNTAAAYGAIRARRIR